MPWLDTHCKNCTATFSTQEEADNHACIKQAKEKPRKQCPTCERTFKDSWHLTRHVHTHGSLAPNTPQLRFTCIECNRGFADNWHYKKHLLQHRSGKKVRSRPRPRVIRERTPSPSDDDEVILPENDPEVDYEIVPKCRICSIEVTADMLLTHSMQHIPDIFEHIGGDDARRLKCVSCKERHAQAQIMLEVLNGHYRVGAFKLNKVIAKEKDR